MIYISAPAAGYRARRQLPVYHALIEKVDQNMHLVLHRRTHPVKSRHGLHLSLKYHLLFPVLAVKVIYQSRHYHGFLDLF